MGLPVISMETTWKTSFESKNFPQFGLFCDFPTLFVLYNFGDQSTLQMNVCAAELNT